MAAEHLYAHFLAQVIMVMDDIKIIIIDKTNKKNPTLREAFWAHKLDTFVPKGLNVRDFE